MNIYDATEQAYKNGYEAGKKDKWISVKDRLPEPKDIPNCFRLLGFLEIPTMTELKERYRQVVKTAHPDIGGSSDYFITIQEAYKQAEQELSKED